MITVACLDMAGTTVQDSGTVMAAFDAALPTLGLQTGTPAYDRARGYAIETMGQSKIEVFRHLAEQDENAAQQANAAFEQSYADGLAAGGAEPIPGAEQAFAALRDQGVRVVLTTGFSAATRDALLASLGWTDKVDLALSPADAGRGRPYPDMILAAMLRLEIDDVAHVAVAGDTSSDLLAGSRAGAGIVAGVLTGAHGRDEFATVPHTHVIDSIADLPGLVATANA